MNMLQVQYFLNSIQTHSIHKTAEKYNMSPQGVSKAIKMLEQELGIVLMERSPKGVDITADGKQILAYFEEIAENYEMILNYCRIANKMPNPKTILGEINLAITPRFSDTYFGKMMYKFNNIYPKIKLRADSMSNDKIINKMQCGEVEFNLAIITVANIEDDLIYLPEYLQKWDLQFIALYTKELYMCGLKKIIDKIGSLYDIAEQYPFLVAGYEYGGIMTKSQKLCDYQMDSIAAQKELIDHHNAIGAYSLDELMMHFDRSRYAYIPFDFSVVLTYGCLLNTKHLLTPEEKVFLAFLVEHFDKET